MRHRGIATVLGAGIAGLTLVPAAVAHHSEPYCKYGAGTLPDNITVQYKRWGEDCNGLRVTLEFGDGRRGVIFYGGDGTDGRSEDADPRTEPPTKKPAEKKRCKKNRKGRRCPR